MSFLPQSSLPTQDTNQCSVPGLLLSQNLLSTTFPYLGRPLSTRSDWSLSPLVGSLLSLALSLLQPFSFQAQSLSMVKGVLPELPPHCNSSAVPISPQVCLLSSSRARALCTMTNFLARSLPGVNWCRFLLYQLRIWPFVFLCEDSYNILMYILKYFLYRGKYSTFLVVKSSCNETSEHQHRVGKPLLPYRMYCHVTQSWRLYSAVLRFKKKNRKIKTKPLVEVSGGFASLKTRGLRSRLKYLPIRWRPDSPQGHFAQLQSC